MADGVTLPGTGEKIATESIGGSQFQDVKIVLGLQDAADLYLDSGQQDKAHSLPVVLPSDYSLPAGESHLGEVAGNLDSQLLEITVPSASSAYAANSRISSASSSGSGNVAAPNEIPNAARANGGSGYITFLGVDTNKKSITPRLRVHFFSASPAGLTLSGNGALYQEKYADAAYRVGYYDLPAMTTAGDSTNSDMSRVIDPSLVRLPYKCASNSTSLFWALECLDAFSGSASQKWSLRIKLDRN
jgi:hypothetical protein